MQDSTERLTTRQQAILQAVITVYLQSGEPVGSASVAGLTGSASSATVRNEMAALTSAGLLEQPHTSAGRIPTARAFKRYVDDLTGAEGVSGAGLATASRQAIEAELRDAPGANALFERTSVLLAALSNGVGIAVATGEGDVLEHVHFSRLAKGRVLAVVVTRAGAVRDRLLLVEQDLSAGDLQAAAAVLNGRFRGWSVESVRAELGRLVEQERSEVQLLMTQVERLWTQAMPEALPSLVFVGGVGNLVGAAGDEASREQLRAVLGALEAKRRLVDLLDAYIDAEEKQVRVVFDLAEQAPEMAGLVLIGMPAKAAAGQRRGTIGVIGRTRIDYETTIHAVHYVATTLNRML